MALGANYLGQGQCSFLVWAPKVPTVDVHLISPGPERRVELHPLARGYHGATVEGVEPGATFLYRLNGQIERPDPASRFQSAGVHGPSKVCDGAFAWEDRTWFGLPLRDYILYELHVGTFTPEGTFEAIIPRLRELRDLGITAIELMPVAQFPGTRNWGYDGVYPYAVQNSYGGPEGLKRLVNAAHRAGLAVVLDVVYNHLGPEGNYLRDYGPYFTDGYRTPWGEALNFDGEHSDDVRHFFLQNALYWQTEFHIDALRLDAVHAIKDFSAYTFLEELADTTRLRAEQLNRRFFLIAESNQNDPRLVSPQTLGGYGLDAQWSDDFHHCLHVLLTGEQDGYYADFRAAPGLLARALRQGYAYTGQYSPFRKRRHGRRPEHNHARQFVVCSQNHDQVGNRMLGDRLSRLTNLEGLKLAAGTVLLSPFIPLLFMGEEYGEPAPFQYVTSHADPDLVEAVRKGRREEFSDFAWTGEAPDPQAESTFKECILNHELLRTGGSHRALYAFHAELIRLRKEIPAIARVEKETLEVQAFEQKRVLQLIYQAEPAAVCLILCFAHEPVSLILHLPSGQWVRLLDSAAAAWGGEGSRVPEHFSCAGPVTFDLSPLSLAVFQLAKKG